MATSPNGPVGRYGETTHEGFMRFANFLWLKVATVISIIAIVAYALIDVTPRPNGGSWYGYILGTIGLGLILWLSVLGVRKRSVQAGRWSLKAWTSAHVYLGLSLVVIGTLHTGFQFGWNVHTLAYALMMLVILSGVFGISVYAALPQSLSSNREEMTQPQMLEALRALDRQLHEAAQPLTRDQAEWVQESLDDDPFGGSVFRRLVNSYPDCGTQDALDEFRDIIGDAPDLGNSPLERVAGLLERKLAVLQQLRRHLRTRAMLEIWLYVHVPVTFALIAALLAHVVSVFFYW